MKIFRREGVPQNNVGSTVTPITIIPMLSCRVPSMTKDDQEYLSKFKLSRDYKKKTKHGNRHDIAPFNYLMIETVCILLACLRGVRLLV